MTEKARVVVWFVLGLALAFFSYSVVALLMG
jgi:hypothetical protein